MHRRALLAGAACAAAARTGSRAASPVSPPRFVAHALPMPGARPYLIVPGPDGAVWFAESGVSRIGRLDRATGAITEFPTPTPDSGVTGVVAGADGNLWFTENAVGKIGRLTPAGATAEFACSTRDCGPGGIARGPDGCVWFLESNAGMIAAIAPDGTIRETPLGGLTPGAHPLALAFRGAEPWFSEPDTDRMARFADGRVEEIALAPGRQPRAVIAHPNGDIWFVATGARLVGRIDTRNRLREFPLPDPRAQPRSLAVALDGNLWITVDVTNTLACMAPDGALLGEFPMPAPLRGPRGMTAAPNGHLFFSAYGSGHIGELIP